MQYFREPDLTSRLASEVKPMTIASRTVGPAIKHCCFKEPRSLCELSDLYQVGAAVTDQPWSVLQTFNACVSYRGCAGTHRGGYV